jgi:hypothetical protein
VGFEGINVVGGGIMGRQMPGQRDKLAPKGLGHFAEEVAAVHTEGAAADELEFRAAESHRWRL